MTWPIPSGSGDCDVINPLRDELKFIVDHGARSVLLALWDRLLAKDPHTNAYAQTPVLSQYYDTPGLDFYEEKLDGIGARNKLRLRTYDWLFRPGAAVFPEIKQRWDDKIRKIRGRIDRLRPEHLEDPRAWVFTDPDDERRFGPILHGRRLERSAQVLYLREAYQGTVETDVRVTFDSHLMGLFPGEAVTRAILAEGSRRLMSDSVLILEVKATGRIPAWIHDGVERMELRQQPIPKYVMAVERLGLPHSMPASGVYA